MAWESPAGLQARWWLGSPSWRSTRPRGHVKYLNGAKPKRKPISKIYPASNIPETYLVPFTLVPWNPLGKINIETLSCLGFPTKSSTQVLANFSHRRLVRDSLAFRCTFCRDRPAATAQTAAPLSKLTLDLLGVRKVKMNGFERQPTLPLKTCGRWTNLQYNLTYVRKCDTKSIM